MRVEHTVWKSAVDERELLRLERQTGTISVPICTITVTQLRELLKAGEECVELAALPRTITVQNGGEQ
jgi:hypothetical protein